MPNKIAKYIFVLINDARKGRLINLKQTFIRKRSTFSRSEMKRTFFSGKQIYMDGSSGLAIGITWRCSLTKAKEKTPKKRE
jgi:hypothetical protein